MFTYFYYILFILVAELPPYEHTRNGCCAYVTITKLASLSSEIGKYTKFGGADFTIMKIDGEVNIDLFKMWKWYFTNFTTEFSQNNHIGLI